MEMEAELDEMDWEDELDLEDYDMADDVAEIEKSLVRVDELMAKQKVHELAGRLWEYLDANSVKPPLFNTDYGVFLDTNFHSHERRAMRKAMRKCGI